MTPEQVNARPSIPCLQCNAKCLPPNKPLTGLEPPAGCGRACGAAAPVSDASRPRLALTPRHPYSRLRAWAATTETKKGADPAPFFSVAGLTGLEPATSGVTGRHSNRLSYNPSLFKRDLWWAMTGSNRRHPPCKRGALPTELIAQPRTLILSLLPPLVKPKCILCGGMPEG